MHCNGRLEKEKLPTKEQKYSLKICRHDFKLESDIEPAYNQSLKMDTYMILFGRKDESKE